MPDNEPIMQEPTEEWRQVPGYDWYDVSSLGRVRSRDRYIEFKSRGVPAMRLARGRILSPVLGGSGYWQVSLGAGKPKLYVAHLVALAFIGPRPAGFDVCHNDGCRTNNAVENLRYDSRLGNVDDTRKHGRLLFGERQPQAKLTEEQVRSIRTSSMSQSRLAAKYSVSQSNISQIISRGRWGHVQ